MTPSDKPRQVKRDHPCTQCDKKFANAMVLKTHAAHCKGKAAPSSSQGSVRGDSTPARQGDGAASPPKKSGGWGILDDL